MAKKKKNQERPGLIQRWRNERKERKLAEEEQKRYEQAQEKQRRIEIEEALVQSCEDELARHEAREAALNKRYERGEGNYTELQAEITAVRGQIDRKRDLLNVSRDILARVRRSDDGILR